MKRLIFIVAFMSWAAWSALTPVDVVAQGPSLKGVAICTLKPGRSDADTTFLVIDYVKNLRGRAADRWSVSVQNDTCDVTFYQNVADTGFSFTIPFIPGMTLSSEAVGNPAIDSLTLDCTGTNGWIQFLGFCFGN